MLSPGQVQAASTQEEEDDQSMSHESKNQKSKTIKKKNSTVFPKSPKINASQPPGSFTMLSNLKDQMKDNKRLKNQQILKMRRDSNLTDVRRERTYSKLFEVVKCRPSGLEATDKKT